VIARIRRRLRGSGRIVALYRGVRGGILGTAPRPARVAATPADLGRLKDLRRIGLRPAVGDAPRLNLIIPSVNPTATFGGIRTALDLFASLGDDSVRKRILTLAPVDPDGEAAVPDYRLLSLASDDDPVRSLVSLGGPAAGSLAVGGGDRFVATFWTTAELAVWIRAWQAERYGSRSTALAYLIQDFEPGFYPWSAQYVLALETYNDPDHTVAVFNTSLLRDYFHANGLGFTREFVFEPRMAAALRRRLAEPNEPRRRQIVIYGRPTTARNAFPLLIEGLRVWRLGHPGAGTWSVVSVGQAHAEIDLGGGVTVRSLGKLGLDVYATLLRQAAIGVSFMVSPHPSYPPLEMATMGLLTLTNRFGGKDLATWHTNITTLEHVSADGVAAQLSALCDKIEADPNAGARGRLEDPDYLSDGAQFPFAEELTIALLGS
jgi:O-antigen biosynthesis protein